VTNFIYSYGKENTRKVAR